MPYLSIELDVRGRRALVVGAGPEAASKVARLERAGAVITVIARSRESERARSSEHELHPAIEEAAREGRVELLVREPTDADAEGRAVVFLEPGYEALSKRLFERAREAGTLVCTLDRPEVSTFINPAVVSVSGLTMSVSTGGKSPALARRIREDLEALFSDPRLAELVAALGALRDSLPRGERGARIKEAIRGFAIEARLRFPDWLVRGEAP